MADQYLPRPQMSHGQEARGCRVLQEQELKLKQLLFLQTTYLYPSLLLVARLLLRPEHRGGHTDTNPRPPQFPLVPSHSSSLSRPDLSLPTHRPSPSVTIPPPSAALPAPFIPTFLSSSRSTNPSSLPFPLILFHSSILFYPVPARTSLLLSHLAPPLPVRCSFHHAPLLAPAPAARLAPCTERSTLSCASPVRSRPVHFHPSHVLPRPSPLAACLGSPRVMPTPPHRRASRRASRPVPPKQITGGTRLAGVIV